jgi:predicted nucleotidyltransferase
MALPDLNETGDLPVGVYPATLGELNSRFGTGTPRRQEVAARFERIAELAKRTGGLQRLIVFGSYVTDEPDPNDVDLVLVMRDDFRVDLVSEDARPLFDHQRASDELGASIFWVRPAMLFLDTLESFIEKWQVKRDGSRRGIVEVVT